MSEQPLKSWTQAQVDAKAKVDAMAPTEQAYRDALPNHYKRHYRADESYEWECPIVPNDGHGKLTREGAIMADLWSATHKADKARHQENQAKVDRVAMRDSAGRVHFVEPWQADDSARRNGWGHRWRAGGLITKTGLDGRMDFRLVRDEWEPCGYLRKGGERHDIEDPEGFYLDPDGFSWGWLAGGWARLDR